MVLIVKFNNEYLLLIPTSLWRVLVFGRTLPPVPARPSPLRPSIRHAHTYDAWHAYMQHTTPHAKKHITRHLNTYIFTHTQTHARTHTHTLKNSRFACKRTIPNALSDRPQRQVTGSSAKCYYSAGLSGLAISLSAKTSCTNKHAITVADCMAGQYGSAG